MWRFSVAPPFNLYLARPGKFLRPVMAALAIESCGGEPRRFGSLLGALEGMEAASIMADDYIDGSPLRRGGAAAHIAYPPGEAMAAAIAAFYFCWRTALAAIPARRRETAAAWLLEEYQKMFCGQFSELLSREKAGGVSAASYLRQVSNKISILSFSGPLVLGALAAGAARGLVAQFDRIGRGLGLVYHLRGDELNAAGAATGKAACDDVISGSMTYLLSRALSAGGGRAKALLRRSARPRAAQIRELLTSTGACRDNERLKSRIYSATLRDIARCAISAEFRGLLADSAHYMGFRRTK